MKTMRNTKWNDGPRGLDLGPLPPELAEFTGIMPTTAEVDSRVGPELLLTVFDGSISRTDIEALGTAQLHIAAGMVAMEGGPLGYLVFMIPNPAGGGEPWAAYEMTMNPHDARHLGPFVELARQSHWHMAIVGEGLSVLDVLEFENRYGLHDTLEQFVEAAQELPCLDFDLAKAEFEATYTIADLWNMAQG